MTNISEFTASVLAHESSFVLYKNGFRFEFSTHSTAGIYTYVTHEHSHEIHVPNFLKPFPLPVSPFIIIYFISIILYLNS